jgi:hypothetical protein
MSSFNEIINTYQALAISNTLNPTELSLYRSICRSYSSKFNTPLDKVLDMDVEMVLLNYYEDQLESMDLDKYSNLEHLKDIILTIEDPEYQKNKNQEEDDYINKLEELEEERIKSGKSLSEWYKKPSKKTLLEKEELIEEKKPTQGFINLEYLENIDKEH